jgi:hypothetical protein
MIKFFVNTIFCDTLANLTDSAGVTASMLSHCQCGGSEP